MVSIKRLFRKPKFLQKSKPRHAAPVHKPKHRKPSFVRTRQFLKRANLRFVQPPKMLVARKREELVQKIKQLVIGKPKQFIQRKWKDFEKTDTFRKYKPRVENSKWFKKIKPIVMKTVKRSEIQKYDAVTEMIEREKADRVHKYTEERFQLLIQEALEEKDPSRRLHELKEMAYHIDAYLEKLVARKKKTEKKKLGIFTNNAVPGTAEYLKKITEHLDKMSAMKMDLQEKIDYVVENNIVAIAKDTNYAWTLGSYRTAYTFATAAAKYIRENVPDDIPSTGRHARKDNNGPAPV